MEPRALLSPTHSMKMPRLARFDGPRACYGATASGRLETRTSASSFSFAAPLSSARAASAAPSRRSARGLGDDQRRGGVEHRYVAIGVARALEHAAQRARVMGGVAADRAPPARRGQAGVFRRHEEGAELAVRQRDHMRGAGGGQLVEPVAPMDEPRPLRAELGEGAGQRLQQIFRIGADQLPLGAGRIAQGAEQIEQRAQRRARRAPRRRGACAG